MGGIFISDLKRKVAVLVHTKKMAIVSLTCICTQINGLAIVFFHAEFLTVRYTFYLLLLDGCCVEINIWDFVHCDITDLWGYTVNSRAA